MRRSWLAGCAASAMLAGPAGGHAPQDPLLRPIEPETAARWLKPQTPTRIFGNFYLVGFAGLNVGLIRTSAGLILIDAAVPQAVPDIQRNIRSLGFDPKDIKLILSTEPHWDHAGGLAALARSTGASVIAGTPAVAALRRGKSGPDDPQAAWLVPFPGVARVRAARAGETLRLGDTVVTAVPTPGHTAGSMSWTWRTCEAARCAAIVFGSSLRPLAAGDYRFSDPHRAPALAAFRRTFATLRALPCDILLTAHPDQSGGDAKFSALLRSREPNPFIDPGACGRYADKYEHLLADRLREEAAPR